MSNIGKSIRAKLGSLARKNLWDTEFVLRRYVLERFLFRMSNTAWRESYSLKGGLLIPLWNDGDFFRPTTDIDFNGNQEDGTLDDLRCMIEDVSAAAGPQDDGVDWKLDSMEVAKSREGRTPGGKLTLNTTVDTAQVRIRVDVGFGNRVTPDVTWVDYPSLLDMPSARIMAYPPETTIAEKFHAMAQHGLYNTRLKDYYDIWMLSRRLDLDPAIVGEAIHNTFSHQERNLPEATPAGLTEAYVSRHSAAWDRLKGETFLGDPPPDLTSVVEDIKALLLPSLEHARSIEDAHEISALTL